MKKIFLAFYNGINTQDDPYAMPIFYEAFIESLKNNGNDVFAVMHSFWDMDFVENEIPEELLAEIKNFNPDIIFLFNNSFYDLSSHFDCPIVIYEVDSPIYYRNKEVLKSKPNRYDYFVAASSSCDVIHSEFGVPMANILQVPFFSEIYPENIEQKNNICFIGTKFINTKKHCLNKFMEINPTDEERAEYLSLVKTLENNVFIPKEELLKNTVSEKILSTFEPYDLIFMLSDHKRTNILSSIADLGLSIWGTSNWATDPYNDPYVMLNFHKEQVYSIRHNQDIYNSSKIGINIGHLQAKNGFPWRVFDIMASNACLVTEFHGDFSKYLPGLKLPYYSNAWEAREICKKLLENDNYRLDIVAKSQEIVNKNYRFTNVLDVMEDYLGISLRSSVANNAKIKISNLNEWRNMISKPKLKFKDKIRYKVWKHCDKILKRKGII